MTHGRSPAEPRGRVAGHRHQRLGALPATRRTDNGKVRRSDVGDLAASVGHARGLGGGDLVRPSDGRRTSTARLRRDQHSDSSAVTVSQTAGTAVSGSMRGRQVSYSGGLTSGTPFFQSGVAAGFVVAGTAAATPIGPFPIWGLTGGYIGDGIVRLGSMTTSTRTVTGFTVGTWSTGYSDSSVESSGRPMRRRRADVRRILHHQAATRGHQARGQDFIAARHRQRGSGSWDIRTRPHEPRSTTSSGSVPVGGRAAQSARASQSPTTRTRSYRHPATRPLSPAR